MKKELEQFKAHYQLLSGVTYTLTPAFQLDEKAWFMWHNQVKSAKIIRVHLPEVWKNSKGQIEMTSTTYALDGYTTGPGSHMFHEVNLYKSKELLLKSL